MRSMRYLGVLTVVVGAFTIFVGNALANSTGGDGSNPVITVDASSVGAFDFKMKGTILEDVRLPGTQQKSPRCEENVSGWNSGRGINGRLYWFWDTKMKVCPNRNSPTGWVKVGGGKTGRDCDNPVSFRRKPPGPVVKVFTIVRSFAKLRLDVKALASAKVVGRCPNIDVSGDARASGIVRATITRSWIVKAGGRASRLRVLIREDLKAKGVAIAAARLKLSCGAVPPGQPPPQQPPPPPPGKARVEIRKIAEDSSGRELSAVPTNTFTFVVTCDGQTRTVVYNSTPTSAGECTIGGAVTITENAASGWDILSPNPQSFTVSSTGVTAVFKNRQKPVQPPPKANQPPTGVIKVPAHLIVGGAAGKVCADAVQDPDGNSSNVSAAFLYKDEAGNTLNLATGPVFREDDALCQMVNPPGYPTNVKVYATLTDEKGLSSAPLFGNFPVVANPDPD